MELTDSPSPSPVLPKRTRAVSAAVPVGELSVRVGDRLGRYVIMGRLGQGGMGIVYEAEDSLLNRRVAIKLLPKAVSSNHDALHRFLLEAQGAAKLNHPNVVAVYDIGETDGTHYIVMELIEGGSAQDILRNRGPFHWVEATTILMDVCRGVAAAHKAGLIHRDIKPANILRSTEGVVKLADFGLVKPAGVSGSSVTALGEVVGTPHYMSHEQSRCAALDERSDIYSLGATYFALLTGRPPFNAADPMQILFAHCAHPIPDPRELVTGLPEACDAIIRKTMAKNRSQRHAGAGELLADLEQVVGVSTMKVGSTVDDERQPPLVWSRTVAAETTSALSLADGYPGERTQVVKGPGGRRWRPFALPVLCALVGAIALGVFPVTRREPGNLPVEPSITVTDDWHVLAADADEAIRIRNASAMKRVLDSIQVLQKRNQGLDDGHQEGVRQTLARLRKALAFRESITEKGLVLGLDGQVSSVVFSPDDRWLAAGQSHAAAGALVWDSLTGEKEYTLWPGKDASLVKVQSLAFADDSSVLAAACTDNMGVKLWFRDGGRQSTLDVGPGVNRATSVVFSPVTRDLVVGLEPFGSGKGKPYLKIWDVDTGREPFKFKGEHSDKVSSVAYCTGGHQIASGSSDKRVVMWNAATGRIWRELRTGLDIHAIACSPQGRTLAVAGQDREMSVLQFWDYAGERLLAVKPCPQGACRCIAFARHGDILACGNGTEISLWNPETYELLGTLTGHGYEVTSLAFSNEGGILASGSLDQTMRLWDVTRYLPTRPER